MRFYEQYVRPHARLIALVVTGCLAVCAIRPTPPNDSFERYTAALIAAHTRDRDAQHDARVLAEHEREAMRREGVRLRIFYGRQRSVANVAVEALPKASITGDTVTVRGTAYVVPLAIAGLIADQQKVIAIQLVALAAADTAIATTRKEAEAADSVATHATKEADAATALADDEKARADALTPSKWERFKGAVRSSSRYAVVAVGAFALGMVAK